MNLKEQGGVYERIWRKGREGRNYINTISEINEKITEINVFACYRQTKVIILFCTCVCLCHCICPRDYMSTCMCVWWAWVIMKARRQHMIP